MSRATEASTVSAGCSWRSLSSMRLSRSEARDIYQGLKFFLRFHPETSVNERPHNGRIAALMETSTEGGPGAIVGLNEQS